MRSSYIVSLVAAGASLVAAQKMVPTAGSATFPACAVGCQVLIQAQSTCTPPNAIQATQLTYDNCFCQIPLTQDLYTTGETICTSQCSSHDDRALLSAWFVNFCKQVGAGVDPVAGTATTSASASASATSSSTATDSSTTTSTGPWITTHWQWIIMLIFLFFGFLAIGLGARWLKKRHNLKLDQTRATSSGFPVTEDKMVDRERALSPEIWGPHQHMAANKGFQYNSNGLPIIDEDSNIGKADKLGSKRSSRVEVTEVKPIPPPSDTKPLKSPTS